MNTKPKRAIKKFYSYAPADKELRNELDGHLAVLRHPGRIIGWHDGVILAGTERKREINKQLDASDVILLLISHNFMASEDCLEQMARALGRHRTGKVRAIPIILSPVAWENSPIGKLQVLPLDKKPITMHSNQDEALREIVQEIDKVVSGLIRWIDATILKLIKEFNRQYFQMDTPEEEWVNNIWDRINFGGVYSNTINEIKTIIEDDTSAWWADKLIPSVVLLLEKEISENYLKRVKRAFRVVFGFRGHDEFDDIETYRDNLTSRHIKAKMAFKRASQVLRQDPNNAKAYYIQSIALIGLTKNEDALIALNKAQKIDPHFPGIYDLQCTIFAHLGRIEEALDALAEAERLNPGGIENYSQVKAALSSLRRPARWLQLTLPPQRKPLTLPQFAESLLFSKARKEVNAASFDLNALEHDDKSRSLIITQVPKTNFNSE